MSAQSSSSPVRRTRTRARTATRCVVALLGLILTLAAVPAPVSAAGTSGIHGLVIGAGPGIAVDVYSSVYGNVVATTTTDPSSNYYVTGLPPSTYRVRFSDPNHVYATVWNGPGSITFGTAPDVKTIDNLSTTVNKTMTFGGHLTGAATNATGQPLANMVAVAVTATSPAIVTTTTTGTDGIFDLAGLPATGFKVIVVDPDYFAAPPGGRRPAFNGDQILGDLSAAFAAAPTLTVQANQSTSAGVIHLVPSHCDPVLLRPGANLSGVNLSGADLSGCLLTGANLATTDLTLANLSGANFLGATFNFTSLVAANVAGTVFANATWATTQCPDGSTTPVSGGNCGNGAPLTFIADVPTDAVDAAPGNGICATAAGGCTVRAAVQEANAMPTADTIVLRTAQTYTLTIFGAGAETAARRDLDLTGDITITGHGATVRQTANDRAFQIVAGANAHLSDLTVVGAPAANGLPGAASPSSGAPAGTGGRGDDGGAIHNAGTLTLDNTMVTGGTAGNGGAGGCSTGGGAEGTGGAGGRGGGIYNTGVLVMTGGAVVGNRAGNGSSGCVGVGPNGPTGGPPGAPGDGGGIFNGGTMTLSGVTVANNRSGQGAMGRTWFTTSGWVSTGPGSAGGSGGGVFNNATASVDRATISDNGTGVGGTGSTPPVGGDGGGLANSGTATVTNTTIAHNTVAGNGRGAGVTSAGSLTITNATISSNIVGEQATDTGVAAGVLVAGNTTTLRYVTITQNRLMSGSGANGIVVLGGTANIGASIIAMQGNGVDCSGAITSAGDNLESGTTCGFVGAGNLQNSNPALGAIGDNGGPTMTHLPAAASPAVNAIPAGTLGCGTTVATDQRGFVRPSGGACDIGAVER
jgi:hypothetical protein